MKSERELHLQLLVMFDRVESLGPLVERDHIDEWMAMEILRRDVVRMQLDMTPYGAHNMLKSWRTARGDYLHAMGKPSPTPATTRRS